MLQRFQIPLLMAGLYLSLVSNQALVAIEPSVKPAKEKKHSSSQQTDSVFVQSQAELKKLIGELTALQAEYQQPNADKASIEDKFNITRDKAREAALALEQSASAAVLANPENTDACAVVRDVLQAAIQGDDPKKALSLVNILNDAGKANEDVLLNGATAAMITSELDLAEKFLKAAEEAGTSLDKIASLQKAIEAERPKVATEMATRAAEEKADDLPQVKIETTKGTIVVELFENEAPNTVANFISLVENQFYNNTVFHRVIPNFMAQGGDPTGTGTSGPGYTIECECDLPNARKHFLGSLSMAHAGKDTGGSQFFLTFRPTEHLDGRHTVFGRVIEGFDVLPKITRTEGPQARPTQDKIISAEILRKRDHAYEPKTSKES
ncbi:peptidylprolyl isomerase [Planctomycetaceae bacterium]|nr:peptidylprolyl isomerase [Planctomycetaceae bacterium]